MASGSQPTGGGLSTGMWIRLAVAAVALVILVVFIIQNSQVVEIQFIFGSLETRLVWALLLAAALGFLLGWLLPRLWRKRGP